MSSPLSIAILLATGFQETGFVEIQKIARQLGAKLSIISVDQGLVSAWNGNGYGLNFPVDLPINRALAADYNVLIIPGGERSIAKLKTTAHTQRILRGFLDTGKQVIAIENAADLFDFAERGHFISDVKPDGAFEEKENILFVHTLTEDSRADFVQTLTSFLTTQSPELSEAA